MSIPYTGNFPNGQTSPEGEPPDPVTSSIPPEPIIRGYGLLSIYVCTILYEVVIGCVLVFLMILVAGLTGNPSVLIQCLVPPMFWVYSGLLLWALRNKSSKRAVYSLTYMVWKIFRVATSLAAGLYIWVHIHLMGSFSPIVAIFFSLDALIGLISLFITANAKTYLQILEPPDRDPPTSFHCLQCSFVVPKTLLVLVTMEFIWRWIAIVQALFIAANFGETAFEVEVLADLCAFPTLLGMYAVLIYGKHSKFLLPYLVYKVLEVSVSFLLLIFCSYMFGQVYSVMRQTEYIGMALKFAFQLAFCAPALYAVVVYRKWCKENELSNRAFQFSRMNENETPGVVGV